MSMKAVDGNEQKTFRMACLVILFYVASSRKKKVVPFF